MCVHHTFGERLRNSEGLASDRLARMIPFVVEADVKRWFDSYFDDFVALARGDADDVTRLLAYWGVPLLLSTDTACMALVDEAQVVAAAHQMIDGVRAEGYDRAEVLASETVVLNQTCALHRIEAVRLRADGSELFRGSVRYLIAELPAGRRITAVVAEGTP